LSAVRFGAYHGACDALDIEAFHEEHLYSHPDKLHEDQDEIENKLTPKLNEKNPIELFLYDVTNSHLEGAKKLSPRPLVTIVIKKEASNRLSLVCYPILAVCRFRSLRNGLIPYRHVASNRKPSQQGR
jgi:hypothetical protein